jgi:hypothetical protein
LANLGLVADDSFLGNRSFAMKSCGRESCCISVAAILYSRDCPQFTWLGAAIENVCWQWLTSSRDTTVLLSRVAPREFSTPRFADGDG